MANRALLVGINTYPGYPLRGCVNDIEDIASHITANCGFAATDIRMLRNEEATTAGIKSTITGWLLAGAQSGDRLLYHYSGHGSRLVDPAGVLHDVICPIDFDFTLAHSITDEDFRAIFAAVPKGAELNWISDSCHSGDLARSWGMRDVLPRFIPPPPEMAAKIAEAVERRAETRSFGSAQEHLNGVLIAGCRSDQESADAKIEGRFNGAATYYILQQLAVGGNIDLETTVKNAAAELQKHRYVQVPQIRGEPTLRARPFLAVLAAEVSAAAAAASAVSAPVPAQPAVVPAPGQTAPTGNSAGPVAADVPASPAAPPAEQPTATSMTLEEIENARGWREADDDDITSRSPGAGPAPTTMTRDELAAIPNEKIAALVSEEAHALVIAAEIGSKSEYDHKYKHPEWPQGDSGVTIGFGSDLGYFDRDSMQSAWGGLIADADYDRLASCCGLKGHSAQAALPKVKDISVPWEKAEIAYRRHEVPEYGRQTVGAFPNAMELHPHSFGALFSLVYNRGPGMSGASRAEMRNIRDHMAERRFDKVPAEFRAMKHLWVGKFAGLVKRREDEAKLFEKGLLAASQQPAKPVVAPAPAVSTGVAAGDGQTAQLPVSPTPVSPIPASAVAASPGGASPGAASPSVATAQTATAGAAATPPLATDALAAPALTSSPPAMAATGAATAATVAVAQAAATPSATASPMTTADVAPDAGQARAIPSGPAAPVAKSRRVALVIGNSAYYPRRLPNPEKDAALITQVLSDNDFSVIGGGVTGAGDEGLLRERRRRRKPQSACNGQNLGHAAMSERIGQFIAAIDTGAEAIVYYAGHGVQIGDQNYLVPIDADIDAADPLARLIPLGSIVDHAVERAGDTGRVIVLLDACRDNPFSDQQIQMLSDAATKSLAAKATSVAADRPLTQSVATRGLGPPTIAHADNCARTFIAYATAPGAVAYDGELGDANSPFADALGRHLGIRGLPLTDMISRVGLDVQDRVAHMKRPHVQDPWISTNLKEQFFIKGLSWWPVIEMGLLGLVTGVITCFLLFPHGERLVQAFAPEDIWAWAVGLLFALVPFYGTLRWGSGSYLDATFALVGSFLSFAVGLTVLQLFHDTASVHAAFAAAANGTSEEANSLLIRGVSRTLGWLAVAAGVLMLAGTVLCRPRNADWQHYWPNLLLPFVLTAALWSLKVRIGTEGQIGLIIVALVAGVLFAAGNALSLKPQRGLFGGFGALTGAITVGLAMAINLDLYFRLPAMLPGLRGFTPELALVLGAVWFALVGAQLGYCFSYYVPEREPQTPAQPRTNA